MDWSSTYESYFSSSETSFVRYTIEGRHFWDEAGDDVHDTFDFLFYLMHAIVFFERTRGIFLVEIICSQRSCILNWSADWSRDISCLLFYIIVISSNTAHIHVYIFFIYFSIRCFRHYQSTLYCTTPFLLYVHYFWKEKTELSRDAIWEEKNGIILSSALVRADTRACMCHWCGCVHVHVSLFYFECDE